MVLEPLVYILMVIPNVQGKDFISEICVPIATKELDRKVCNELLVA